jgi:hypothetical protein
VESNGDAWVTHSRQFPRLTNIIQSYSKYLSYFDNFTGATDCGIKVVDLYTHPVITDGNYDYCNSKSAFLEAMSGGGHYGINTPYMPRGTSNLSICVLKHLWSSITGCSHRWFTAEEICATLDRFDGIILVGDHKVEMIYAGLRTLLRKKLQSCSMKHLPALNPLLRAGNAYGMDVSIVAAQAVVNWL